MIAVQILPLEDSPFGFVYPGETKTQLISSQTNLALAGIQPDRSVPRAVLMLSRQPRYTFAEAAWLSSVRRSIEFIREQGWTIIASSPGSGWEYVAWFAGRCGIRSIIILPPGRVNQMYHTCETLIIQLDLNLPETTFIMPLLIDKLSKPDRLHFRDRLAFYTAHHRFPVSIRKRGFWQSFLEDSPGVDERFHVDYSGNVKPRRTQLPGRISNMRFNAGWDNMLIHWTRGVYGPWSGETTADYFNELTRCKSGNPRDGFATLRHIALTGVLRGDGRMVRGGVPVISFTERNPRETMESSSYRSALGRWNYEPYGIAINRDRLVEFGTRKVIYGNRNDYNLLNPALKPYYQYTGRRNRGGATEKVNWEKEREWRIIGDIDIESIKQDVMLIVPTREEAIGLRDVLDYEIAVLED